MRPATAGLLAVVLLTGCGEDGLSRGELVERAEALCSEANADLEGRRQPQAPAQIGPYLQGVVDRAAQATSDLEALVAGQPDAAELDRIFLGPLRGQVDALAAYVPQVEAAAKAGGKAVEQLAAPELPAADLEAMRAFGFQACVVTAQS